MKQPGIDDVLEYIQALHARLEAALALPGAALDDVLERLHGEAADIDERLRALAGIAERLPA